MPLQRGEREKLVKVLSAAVGSRDKLEEFVGVKLGPRLDSITGSASLDLMILRVVQWAEAEAQSLEETLIVGAMEMFGNSTAVAKDLPPILENVRRRAWAESKRASIEQIQALPDLVPLVANLADLVKSLQQMAPTADPARSMQAVEAGKRAVEKVQEHGQAAELTRDEQQGLEAIVLASARPALLIQNGDFQNPPETWNELLDRRDLIRRAIAATGRVEVEGSNYPFFGTGFVIAPQVLAIAAFMVDEFAERKRGWKLRAGVKLSVNFLSEYGSSASAKHDVVSVIGVEELGTAGVALLELSDKGGNLPTHLPVLAKPTPKVGHKVALIGYVGRDSRRPSDFLRDTFGNIFDVKRLCPGLVLRLSTGPGGTVRRSVVEHDCSSAGGMSGAPLIDLRTGAAVGVHYGATHLVAGYARRLSSLEGSSLAKDAEVHFVSDPAEPLE